nr:hypothetical protein [Tanacetum cinerariifolium]
MSTLTLLTSGKLHSFSSTIPLNQEKAIPSNFKVKENQEKDKIGSKPDKNGKRVEARKSLKQLQLKEEEKTKKTKKEWPKTHTRIKSYASLKKRRKEKGHFCIYKKVQTQGPKLPTDESCGARDELCKE